MSNSIEDLIRRIGSHDLKTSRPAEAALLQLGAKAAPALRDALTSDDANTRKAAAFLLGKIGFDSGSSAALAAALHDSAPKVRKSAAIALGQLGDPASINALRGALSDEETEWVRPSIILAIGRIGGDAAKHALTNYEARSDDEREALRKGLDRLSGPSAVVRWSDDAALGDRTYAAVPVGLEDVAAAEAADRGVGSAVMAGRGLLHLRGVANPAGILNTLRCIDDVRLLLAEDAPLRQDPDIPRRIADLFDRAELLGRWREWLATDSEALPYRFSLEHIRVPKPVFTETLERVRRKLTPWGFVDSPSGYAAHLRVDADGDATRLWFVPTFELDERFAYRRADVGASINPVVGACLARLVRRGERGLVFDPTCGSATLLIERARLDAGVSLRGIDISPTAVRAATENIIAASLAARVFVQRGDAGDAASWSASCAEVIANLPFGVRSRMQDQDLDELYRGIVSHVARTLEAGGRAVLYTANVTAIRSLLKKTPALSVRAVRTIESGGLRVGVWVIERR